MQVKTTYDKWLDGELRDAEALTELAKQMASLEDKIFPLQENEKILRGHISIVVDRMGGKASVAGFASFVITEPGVTVSYDTKKLDRMIAELVSEGNTDMAQRLTACRSVGSKSGFLRITKAKGANPA